MRRQRINLRTENTCHFTVHLTKCVESDQIPGSDCENAHMQTRYINLLPATECQIREQFITQESQYGSC